MMEQGHFILFNGEFRQHDPSLKDESFTAMQGFFSVTMRSANNEIFFYPKILSHIRQMFRRLHLPESPLLKNDGLRLHKQVCRVFNKNKLYVGAVATVSFFGRADRSAGCMIEAFPLPQRYYLLNTEKIIFKVIHEESAIQIQGSIPFNPFWRKNYDLPFEGSQLTNFRPFDIGLVQDNTLYLSAHPTQFLTFVIKKLEWEVEVKFLDNVTLKDLDDHQTTECLLISDAYGIEQVTGINQMRYRTSFNDEKLVAARLINELNRLVKI